RAVPTGTSAPAVVNTRSARPGSAVWAASSTVATPSRLDAKTSDSSAVVVSATGAPGTSSRSTTPAIAGPSDSGLRQISYGALARRGTPSSPTTAALVLAPPMSSPTTPSIGAFHHAVASCA